MNRLAVVHLKIVKFMKSPSLSFIKISTTSKHCVGDLRIRTWLSIAYLLIQRSKSAHTTVDCCEQLLFNRRNAMNHEMKIQFEYGLLFMFDGNLVLTLNK